MILQSGGTTSLLAAHNSVSMRVKVRPICLASITKTNTEHLRTQLGQLHSEAQATEAKGIKDIFVFKILLNLILPPCFSLRACPLVL